MKKQLLLIGYFAFLWLFTFQANAQRHKTVIHGPIAQQWTNQLKAAAQNNINGARIQYMQPQPIPANLMEILKRFDWLEIGNIHFRSAKYHNYANECCQFNVRRYTAQGQRLEFESNGNWSSRQAGIRDFNLGVRYKAFVSVVKINGRNFFKTHYIVKDKRGGIKHEYAYGQIISYRNGLLVLDETITGKVSEINSLSRFRKVYKAVPKFDFYKKAGFSANKAIDYSSDYSYPKIKAASGNCSNFISEGQLNRLMHQLKGINNESQKINTFRRSLQNQCVTRTQIIKLAYMNFTSAQSRLNFLKVAYDHCYDRKDYYATRTLFNPEKYSPLITQLSKYIKGRENGTISSGGNTGGGNTGGGNTNTNGCTLSNDGFHEVYDILQSISSDANRVTTARILLQQKKCLSTKQVKRLVPLFPKTKTRMQFLKTAYQYTSDKFNYHTLGAVLANAEEKRQLQEIIGKG